LILAYHRINPWYGDDALTVPPGRLKKQVGYLVKKGFRSFLPEDYFSEIKAVPGRYRFSITFDDGFADNLWYALPVLEASGIRPLIFLTAGLIGTDKTLERYKNPERDRFLNWGEVGEMIDRGVKFGSHAINHLHLPSLKDSIMKEEICGSKKLIEDRTGEKVDFFCYPYGDFNEKVIDAVQNAGYTCAFVTPGKRKLDKGRYTVPRTGIYGHNGFLTFMVKIWKDSRKTEKLF